MALAPFTGAATWMLMFEMIPVGLEPSLTLSVLQFANFKNESV